MIFLNKHPRKWSTDVGGTLTCTWCNSSKMKEVDRQPPDRIIYICKQCGKKLTYISTPLKDFDPGRLAHASNNPYGHLRGLVSRIPIIGSNKNKNKNKTKQIAIKG